MTRVLLVGRFCVCVGERLEGVPPCSDVFVDREDDAAPFKAASPLQHLALRLATLQRRSSDGGSYSSLPGRRAPDSVRRVFSTVTSSRSGVPRWGSTTDVPPTLEELTATKSMIGLSVAAFSKVPVKGPL